MRFRGKSIRRKIVALLLVPLVSLTGLWAFATVITGSEALQLLGVADAMRKIGYPADDLVRSLQQERRQTLVHLADPRRSDAQATLRQRQRTTDRMVATFRSGAADGVRDEVDDTARARFTAIEKSLETIEDIRRKVDDNTVSRYGAFQAYNDLIEPYYAFLGSLSAVQDDDLDREGRALVGITRAREAVSREDALLASAFAAGSMSRQDLRAFSDHVAERRVLYNNNLPVLPVADQKIYEDYWRGTNAQALRTAEDAVILAGAGRATHAVDPQRWQHTIGPVLDDLGRMGIDAGNRYADRVEPVAVGVLAKAAAAGVLGLAALVCSLVVSFKIGRGLVRDLSRLRKEAHEVSGIRLPSVMRRLAAGETVDIETEAPRLEYGADELGQVGQALNTLQRAAVEAAVKQADMRRGVSDVFVNLARRSQVLLHRQLTLLDTMERRTEDTDELADLFRLDHLTTRMRRHAEGLVILSGAAPSRQWRKPIQLMDVVRAAVGEVEDYRRVEVRRLPRLAVHGPAVADLTHLLAELLENATVFSPPHTAVQVVGERVANGFTLEIHDRGLGMAPDAMLEANLRLAETPEFELSDTDRLGLFVVSRLAQRQGVRVSLQPSPYGGTTAVVFIPTTLLTETVVGAGGGTKAGKGRGRDEDDTGAQTTSPGTPAERGGTLPLTRRPPLAPVPPAGPARTDRPVRSWVAQKSLPVELEPPLSLFDDEADESWHDGENGWPIPRRATTAPLAPPAGDPGAEQHHQASDALAPLPRRRSPVLVSDHGRRIDDAEAGGEEGEAREPAKDTAGEPDEERTPTGGLPRRVRQASLAPQLKDDPAARSGPPPAPADPCPLRDADEVRAKMAALQRGWQRGREENEADPPGTAAPGTTSEGDGR
ncbi:nitrate- and nitrite sensing domain-containing protein [Streptomyces netropsis]|uniref:nitrate- and nitrite sensing domain-containing protein n=1 Tax=Streptomyces netropsis TaxID=55404 RepID=UPI0037A8BBC1